MDLKKIRNLLATGVLPTSQFSVHHFLDIRNAILKWAHLSGSEGYAGNIEC